MLYQLSYARGTGRSIAGIRSGVQRAMNLGWEAQDAGLVLSARSAPPSH